MRTCPSCSSKNPGSARLCEVCGADLDGTVGRRLPSRQAAEDLGPSKEVTHSQPPSGGEVSVTQGVDMIAGRYKLQEILGRGGVGIVYRARDLDLGEEIAIKVLQGQATRNAQDLERFKREIITARKITHANVIRIHDFGMAGEEAFISMELLSGGTLADRIEDGPMPLEEGLETAIGICEGLEAAHVVGIIHRDIKPDNVIFDNAGRPKLVDFGLARLASAPTRTIGFSGTPFYVSPEQAEGGEVTGRSDIYSLGVLLFEMFTGRLPFLADNLVRLAMLHSTEPPPAPRSVRPDLPAVLEAVILRCLQKSAAVRYATAADVAIDLRAVRDGKAPPGTGPHARDQATVIRSLPSVEPTLPRATARPTPSQVPQQAQKDARAADRTSARQVAPSSLQDSATETIPAKGGSGKIFAMVGVIAVTGVIGALFAVFASGDPEPTEIVKAIKTPAATATIEVIGTETPAPSGAPSAAASPVVTAQAVVSATATKTPRATPTPTKVAVATPRPTNTPVLTETSLVAAAPTPAAARMGTLAVALAKAADTKRRWLYVQVDEGKLDRVPIAARTFKAGPHRVRYFDNAQGNGKPVVEAFVDVKEGKEVLVDLKPNPDRITTTYDAMKPPKP